MRQDDQSVEEVVLVKEEQLSASTAVSIARQFLQRWQPQKQFRHLVLLTDPSYLPMVQFGKGRTHVSFSNWKDNYLRSAQTTSPQAELLSFGDAATLRIRRANGEIEYLQLSGSDAFDLKLDGLKGRVDYVALEEQLPYSSPRLQVHLFVVAPIRTTGEAERIYRQLRKKIGVLHLEVTIRANQWFVDSLAYPWVNPFREDEALPSYDEYSREETFECGVGSRCLRIQPQASNTCP